jgi:hypothetical protein
LSTLTKGEKNPTYGLERTKEWRDNISKANKGQKAWNKGKTNIYDEVVSKNGLWVEGLRLKIGKDHQFCEFSENMNTIPFQNDVLVGEMDKRSFNHKITNIMDFENITEEKVKLL